MGWVLLLITVLAMTFAILNRYKKPTLSLLVAIVIPFTAFYIVGKYEYYNVFTFSTSLYSIVAYYLIFRREPENSH